MSNRDEGNYVSTWSWFWMMFFTAIPILGWILILVWALSGDNETRRNYYRAVILWWVIGIVLAAGFIVFCALVGTGPTIFKNLSVHH